MTPAAKIKAVVSKKDDGWWHVELHYPSAPEPIRGKFLREEHARKTSRKWLSVALGTGKDSPTYTQDDVRTRAAGGEVRRRAGGNFTSNKTSSSGSSKKG